MKAGLDWLNRAGRRAWARPGSRVLASSGVAALALVLVCGFGALGWAAFGVAPALGPLVEERAIPSSLYSRPLRLDRDRSLGAEDLASYLDALGYRRLEKPEAGFETDEEGLLRGWYVRFGQEGLDTIVLRARRSVHPLGPPADSLIETRFRGPRTLAALLVDGAEAPSVELEPVELARLVDDQRMDVRPLNGEPLPSLVAKAVLAAEDDGFEHHGGVSLTGIVRAAWKNARAGEVREGASTITQQLARSRYLSQERTFRRKAREAAMAIVLEQRHSKGELLSAYADRVYLGARDGLSVVGLGAAAYTYFGKRLDDLTLSEAATLAGMIAAPGRYSPRVDPERSLWRRDWVLARMRDLDWIEEAEHSRALAEPVQVAFSSPSEVDGRHYRNAVVRWLREKTLDPAGLASLEASGYLVDGTLDWLDQLHAERSVSERLAALSKSLSQARSKELEADLEAALISIDPRDGSVLAYVGGRDYGGSQFDRVSQARRQIGSLFKPVVFAAAYERHVATPRSRLLDLPVAVSYGEEVWAPDNSNGKYRGSVSAQTALEHSLNAATLRLAARTGIGQVRDTAHRLGLPAGGGPSMVLGATEASLWEVSSAYSVFASDGLRRESRLVWRMFDRDGRELELPSRTPEQILGRDAVRALNAGLQGVLLRGTATQARRAGLKDRLAGKTGTSNDRRDSWFAGFSPERLTVAWLGHDSFTETGYTGASGALPLWTDFMLAVRPHSGYGSLPAPDTDSTAPEGCVSRPFSPRAPTLEESVSEEDDCAPAIGYETWRSRYALIAALSSAPISEYQIARAAARSEENPPGDKAQLAAAGRGLESDHEPTLEPNLELREVVRLDGPFGEIVQRRVRWVARTSG